MAKPNLAAEMARHLGRTTHRNPGGGAVVPADFFSRVQGAGVDLKQYSEAELAAAADEADMDELERAEFLEDAASWL